VLLISEMMKLKLLLTIAILAVSNCAFSQNVKVEEVIDELGGGFNNAYRVTIPHSTEKAVEKSWTSFLKDNRGRVKESKHVIRGENVVIPALGLDSLQIFSRIKEYEDGIILTVAVQQRGIYMNSVTSPANNAQMAEILRGMALSLSRDGIQEKIKSATDVLEDKVKEQNNLRNDNENLTRDNEKMRREIQENENDLKKNNERLESLKNEINAQQQTIETIQSKSRELQ
jgi:hypothetical protein